MGVIQFKLKAGQLPVVIVKSPWRNNQDCNFYLRVNVEALHSIRKVFFVDCKTVALEIGVIVTSGHIQPRHGELADIL